jgi:hypothetical protein
VPSSNSRWRSSGILAQDRYCFGTLPRGVFTVERLNYRNSMGQWCRCATAEHPFMPVRTSFHTVCLGVKHPSHRGAPWCNGATARRRLRVTDLRRSACGIVSKYFDRRALLHLSYSCAPPYGRAMLVTQDPSRTLADHSCCYTFGSVFRMASGGYGEPQPRLTGTGWYAGNAR